MSDEFVPDEERSSPLKYALIVGLITAGSFILLQSILYSTVLDKAKEPPVWLMVIQYIMLLTAALYTIILHRDRNYSGSISYGKALGATTLMVLFCSVIMGFYLYIFMYMNPELLAQIKQTVFEGLEKRKDVDEDTLEKQKEMMDRFMTPLGMGFGYFIRTFFGGFVVALIASIFKDIMKKERQVIS